DVEPSVGSSQFQFTRPAGPFGLVNGSLETMLLQDDYSLDDEFATAGGHAAAATAQVFSTRYRHRHKGGGHGISSNVTVDGLVKQLRTDIPPGLVGNLKAVTELCDEPTKLIDINAADCPPGSVVGEARYAGEPFGTSGIGN